jgi:hypothetical protein
MNYEVIKCMHGNVFSACLSDSVNEDWKIECDFYMKNFCTIEKVKQFEFKDVRKCCPKMAHFNHKDPDNPIVPNQLKIKF